MALGEKKLVKAPLAIPKAQAMARLRKYQNGSPRPRMLPNKPRLKKERVALPLSISDEN